MSVCAAYLAAVRGHDEEGLYGVLAEVGMSLVTKPRLHLVIPIQTLQCGLGDVHLTAKHSREGGSG